MDKLANRLYGCDVAGLGVRTWEFKYHNAYADFPGDNYAMSYYVTVSDLKGNTWDSKYTLTSLEMDHSECQSRMERYVSRIKEALQTGGCISLEHWDEGHPAYGSDAWQQWEREELRPAIELVNRGMNVEQLPDAVRVYL